MKIILITNIATRELSIMEKIKFRLENLDKSVYVKIVSFYDEKFFSKIISVKPDIIVTFPLNAKGLSEYYYNFKFLFDCKIICMTTEGIADFKDEEALGTFVGLDNYNNDLVDYQIYWGQLVAECWGGKLLEQKKLKSKDCIKTFGYVKYEDYFSNQYKVSNYLIDKISRYKKEDIVFFASSFSTADLDADIILKSQDYVDLADENYSDNIARILKEVQYCKEYREKILETIRKSANKYSDKLFIIKLHPCEYELGKFEGAYSLLEGIPNIIIIKDEVKVIDIIKSSSLLLHIGSTVVCESYIEGISSVYVTYSKIHNNSGFVPFFYKKFILPSSMEVECNDLEEFFDKYFLNDIKLNLPLETNKILFDYFNIKHNCSKYEPSNDIAKFILELKDKELLAINKKDAIFLDSMRNRTKDIFYGFTCLIVDKIVKEDLKPNDIVIRDFNNYINYINLKFSYDNFLINKTFKYLIDNFIENICNEKKYVTFKENAVTVLESGILEYKNDYLELVFKKLKRKSIVIFGTGGFCKKLLKLIKYLNEFENLEINIVCFTDNNKKYDNIESKEVIFPNELSNYEYDYIVIASSSKEEIESQLLKMGIVKSNIFAAELNPRCV